MNSLNSANGTSSVNTINFVSIGSLSGTTTVTNGLTNGSSSLSTNTTTWTPYSDKRVIDVIIKHETIEILYVQRALYTYTTINSTVTISSPQQVIHNSDRVFKEIYGVKDGKMTLLKTVNGRVIPPQLEETYDFEE